MAYTIIVEDTPQKMVDKINEGLSKGFRPVGDLCVTPKIEIKDGNITSTPIFYEAMIKDIR